MKKIREFSLFLYRIRSITSEDNIFYKEIDNLPEDCYMNNSKSILPPEKFQNRKKVIEVLKAGYIQKYFIKVKF